MAVPLGSRAPAMTVLGPPRYTSRRAAAGRYAAAIAVFDAIITFHPTEPSCRASSSITCKTVSSSTSAPPTALAADMVKTPASQRASNSGRGMWRSCSPASRHCAMIGARVRTRSPHTLVWTAMSVVIGHRSFLRFPFALATPSHPQAREEDYTPLSTVHTACACSIGAQGSGESNRVKPCRQCRRADEITEHDGDLAPLRLWRLPQGPLV